MRVNSHTSHCVLPDFKPTESGIVMHVMHTRNLKVFHNAWGRIQHFIKSCLAIVIVGI